MSLPDADPVLATITQTIVDRFAPERIVLFGSRGRGDHEPDSDYDLIIVLDTPLNRNDRDRPIREALRGADRAIDVIVYTPAEFERARRDVGALAYAGEVEGRVLYDRVPSRWPRQVREELQDVPDSLADWLERAENDIAAMTDIAAGSRARDGMAFHAHQATEKFLKSALIRNHVRPPRTHFLLELLHQAPAKLRDDPQIASACRLLDALWPNMRYPAASIPTLEEADAAATAARDVQRIVLEYLRSRR